MPARLFHNARARLHGPTLHDLEGDFLAGYEEATVVPDGPGWALLMQSLTGIKLGVRFRTMEEALAHGEAWWTRQGTLRGLYIDGTTSQT